MSFHQVILRQLKRQDAQELALAANNKKIADNLRDMFPHPYSLNDAEWFIDFALNESSDHRWVIEVNGDFAGLIGLHVKEDVYKRNLEIGYWLGEGFWGKGVMTDAIGQAVRLGFNELECHRIYAGIFSPNKGSMKALEKNGFRLEGIFKESIYKNGEYLDEYRYALLREDLV